MISTTQTTVCVTQSHVWLQNLIDEGTDGFFGEWEGEVGWNTNKSCHLSCLRSLVRWFWVQWYGKFDTPELNSMAYVVQHLWWLFVCLSISTFASNYQWHYKWYDMAFTIFISSFTVPLCVTSTFPWRGFHLRYLSCGVHLLSQWYISSICSSIVCDLCIRSSAW